METQFEWPHVICCQQEKFSRQWLEEELFPEARLMRDVHARGGSNILQGKRAVSLFYQQSTRTAGSLALAMDFLGGRVAFATENAREFSSAAKGESLEDAIRVWNRYRPDVIFLRYDHEIGAELAAKVSIVPIINAGDRHPEEGEPMSDFSGQHPTQAFLDLFTIQERRGRIDGLKIAMVGDLKNGRTVRSLCYLLGKFDNIKIYFVAPECAQMKCDVRSYLSRHNVQFGESYDLRDVAPVVDVVYQTRTQKECNSHFRRSRSGIGEFFLVDGTVTSKMRKDAIIMHPFPREDEISREVDSDPRAFYLTQQIDNGLYTRMALLKMMLAPQGKL